MADWNPEANDIFLKLLELPAPEQRKLFLDEACGDNGALRAQVEALLAASENAGDFLEQPAVEQEGSAAIQTSRWSEEEGAPPVHLRETQVETSDDGESLDFLDPSQQPGSLGRLGHYEVLEIVGRGGMGVVLRAFDEKLHRVVAIKAMTEELATSAAARKRFTREAKAAAAVRNEHVIDIHAVEDTSRVPYLVMEYVRGGSLQDRLDQNGTLELKEILRIGLQVAAGLAAAHAQGLVHRDIKPANILLENGVERVKITDFGLARLVDDASLTQSGVIAGTPLYMSPEQAEGLPVDHRSDLFSLGSVLYALCAGHPPFRAGSTLAVLKRVCEDTPRPIRQINPEVPDSLSAIVEKLHAKDPVARYQSAADVAELLSQHLAGVQQPLVAPVPTLTGRRWFWPWAVVGLLLPILVVTEATGVTRLFRKGAATPSGREKNPSQPAHWEPLQPEQEFVNSVGATLHLIPAGEFTMGSPESEPGRLAEEFAHKVRISRRFYLGVNEVTQEEYRAVMGENPSWFSATGGGKDRLAELDTSRFPVDRVSWQDAIDFCRKLSERPTEKNAGHVYRLPTEAEWEYACRADAQTPFHFGNDLSAVQANFDGRSPYGTAARGPYLQRTTPVGSYAANAWGLHDMHGNVWEWCQDSYQADYYRHSATDDPESNAPGELRVVRGGSWYSTGAACRSAFRHKLAPDSRSYYVGFRVACNVP